MSEKCENCEYKKDCQTIKNFLKEEKNTIKTVEKSFLNRYGWVTKKTATVKEIKDFLESDEVISQIHSKSKVNPVLMKKQVYDLFANIVANKKDDEVLHYLAFKNLVKEFC